MKLSDALNIYNNLVPTSDTTKIALSHREDLPFKLSYAIKKNLSLIEPFIMIYKHKLNQLINDAGFIINEDNSKSIVKENQEEFAKNHQALLDEEIDMKVYSIGIEVFNDKHNISAATLSILEMIGILRSEEN